MDEQPRYGRIVLWKSYEWSQNRSMVSI